MPERKKIAIIGAGISGLGAAYQLYPHHDITVYEKSGRIGGHARTLTVSYADREVAVDTGFIVYNEKNYPALTALFRHLQIVTAETSMTFGVTDENDFLEWGAQNLNALFAQRRNLFRPAFYRFLADILKFNNHARRVCMAQPDLNLGQLIDRLGLGTWFRDYYILPMGSAIWSCPLETMLGFPASFFVDFFDRHGLLTVTQQPQWRTVVGGSRAYVDRLTAGFKNKILTGQDISSINRQNGKIQVTVKGRAALYDQVVFACPASETLRFFADATPEEKVVLGAFRQQKNIAYLHKDATLMPRRKACWSSWVYHAGAHDDTRPIAVTYWMNRLQHIDDNRPLFLSLNPQRPLKAQDIFDEHVFYHPIYDPAAVTAQTKLAALQGQNDAWFCGAYTGYGFHEDGLASALTICRQMGVAASWP